MELNFQHRLARPETFIENLTKNPGIQLQILQRLIREDRYPSSSMFRADANRVEIPAELGGQTVDESPYIRDAADYQDWWYHSGTALGGGCAGSTFKLLQKELSEAGANAVVAARFLDENQGGIDPGLWRQVFVFGQVGNQVTLTLRALEAIGAVGVVAALREAAARPSPIAVAQELLRTRNYSSPEVAETLQRLRDGVALGSGLVLGEPQAPARPAFRPAPPPDARIETWDEVRRRLDAYVRANREALAGDVARYGDPRTAPGFDREVAAAARARRVARLRALDHQRGEIDGLRLRLDQLRSLAATEPPESPRLNRAARKVRDAVREYAGRDPDDLTPEIRDWLDAAERFLAEHPGTLNPPASRDARVLARLASIGEYEVALDRETPAVWWDSPAGLDCDWAEFRLGFFVLLERKPAPSRVDAALDALCDEHERLRARWDEVRLDLERYVVECFGGFADNLDPEGRAAYADEDGGLVAAKVLGAVAGGTIAMTCRFEDAVHLEIHLDVPWDEEHGLPAEFDADGAILRWS